MRATTTATIKTRIPTVTDATDAVLAVMTSPPAKVKRLCLKITTYDVDKRTFKVGQEREGRVAKRCGRAGGDEARHRRPVNVTSFPFSRPF